MHSYLPVKYSEKGADSFKFFVSMSATLNLLTLQLEYSYKILIQAALSKEQLF